MKVEARVYRCSACGAPAGEGQRDCVYCRAPVATVRCARCFHMNTFEARHCSACGTELGLEPRPLPGAGRCPGCAIELEGLDSGLGPVLDCPRCGGQFVGHQTLRALLERKLADSVKTRPAPLANPLEQAVVYRACPLCSALMHRKNFGVRSGVIVDICWIHGTWFDVGELPRVLSFVERGGLERALDFEKIEPRRSRSPQAPLFSSSDPRETTDVTAIADAVLGLLDLAVTLLKRTLP